MKFISATTLLTITTPLTLYVANVSNAFTLQYHSHPLKYSAFVKNSNSKQNEMYQRAILSSPKTTGSLLRPMTQINEKMDDDDDEIRRLRSMAAQLRAEASKLEAEKAEELSRAAQKAFKQFDTDNDGVISVSELKSGLDKAFKIDLPQTRAEELMKYFDVSGDGVLQVEEFVTESTFRNKLDGLAREEKEFARKADQEAVIAAEAQRLAEARLDFLNDKPPTQADKIISIIPYFFPLLDGLQYGKVLFEGNLENPIVIGVATLYALYRSIPFSGFVAFLALNFLSNNPKLNRLVRFNMQQAIFLDIALIVPGLATGLFSIGLKVAGGELPASFGTIFPNVIFATLLLSIAYCTISSLLGTTPDKLPFISDSVSNRMPSIDMFDDKGRFVPRESRSETKEKENENEKDDENTK